MSEPRSHEPFQLIDTALFDAVLAEARTSARLRKNHDFHRSPKENPNRLLNVLLHGTYIAPHRHLHPPKPEAFLVLRGQVAFFVFEEGGRVARRMILGRGPGDPAEDLLWGIDVAPGTWHTLAPVTPHAVCYEVKPGPYVASEDKEPAPWAPREGDPAAQAYLRSLLDLVR